MTDEIDLDALGIGGASQRSADAVRKARQRERERTTGPQSPLLYESEDWSLFCNRNTVHQKAGCDPNEIGRVILKELTDNALDADALDVAIRGNDRECCITDDGPGLSPDEITRVFAVNRPLRSSKRKRLPTRGMLGNGLRVVMGAVTGYEGRITVASRGVEMDLAINPVTGDTIISAKRDVTYAHGLTVTLKFPRPIFDAYAYGYARESIEIARGGGRPYTGHSQKQWYAPADLRKIFIAAPPGATVGEVRADLFGDSIADDRPARDLTEDEAAAIIAEVKGNIPPPFIGSIGRQAFPGEYGQELRIADIDGVLIPYYVEVWVTCSALQRAEKSPRYYTQPLVNRSRSLAHINYSADSGGLGFWGCGLDFKITQPKRADYNITISLITPYIRLTNDGKSPYLLDFQVGLEKAIGTAAHRAYRDMARPAGGMTTKDAAWQVMRAAYLKASDNNQLPAKARQIMYAARPDILRLSGKKELTDSYFTQTLLPDYLTENPVETANWDVIYDARGHLHEPHTGVSIPLGTLPVRQYLGEREAPPIKSRDLLHELYPTRGPINRYRNVLFIEKEGFDELFEQVKLADRYDLTIMSTKGMSNISARKLLDEIAPYVDNVFVLHDFDISGFSIVGTLATDSRRYEFTHKVPVVDFGLRLPDIDAMGLEAMAETVKVDSIWAKIETLTEHGASQREIDFLANPGGCRRVELNAMSSRQIVNFIEEKLKAHGVTKVIPSREVLDEYARSVVLHKLRKEALDKLEPDLAARAQEVHLPADLTERVQETLKNDPTLSWDDAVALLSDPSGQ